MKSPEQPLYGLIKGDGRCFQMVYLPKPDGRISRRYAYSDSIEVFGEHAGSEVPIIDLRTLREPFLILGAKEEYPSSGPCTPVRPSLADLTVEAAAKGATVWSLTPENYAHAKSTGRSPGVSEEDLGRAATQTLSATAAEPAKLPPVSEMEQWLSDPQGPVRLAETLAKARQNGGSTPAVCTWLHKGTEMYHFDGIDAVAIVAPALGINRPGVSKVDPKLPYGNLGVHRSAIEARPDALQLIHAPSIAVLKTVQAALDAKRPEYMGYAAQLDALAPLPAHPLQRSRESAAALLAELEVAHTGPDRDAAA